MVWLVIEFSIQDIQDQGAQVKHTRSGRGERDESGNGELHYE